jgi:hypothetical protein
VITLVTPAARSIVIVASPIGAGAEDHRALTDPDPGVADRVQPDRKRLDQGTEVGFGRPNSDLWHGVRPPGRCGGRFV